MAEQAVARILVADDEPNILMLTSVMLRDVGYEVFTAENGQQAIEQAQKLKPDLIVTDIMMPEKNGFEVCQAVRNMPEISHTPIIILSALGDEYNKISGFEGGADDYVTKPFNIEELKARVAALLIRSKGKVCPKEECKVVSPVQSAALESTFVGKRTSIVDQIVSGSSAIDKVLGGGFPKGGNILLIGKMGGGKSNLCRKFIATGLNNDERCMIVTLDDDPSMLRKMISMGLGLEVTEFEKKDRIRIVDAYSWSSGGHA
ncbi:MAG: response regulator, partial [Candidatus Margulisiibacteriota bacterium]